MQVVTHFKGRKQQNCAVQLSWFISGQKWKDWRDTRLSSYESAFSSGKKIFFNGHSFMDDFRIFRRIVDIFEVDVSESWLFGMFGADDYSHILCTL